MKFALALALAAAAVGTKVADFRDIAAQAGLVHVFPNGGAKSKRHIVETTGSGVALFDYDNDGLTDIFLASGPGAPSRLYRNAGNLRFIDATNAAGIEPARANQSAWAQGACAGDYDNDGFIDLFVTAYGPNRLLHNLGGRRFSDVTAKSGLSQDRIRYNTGCAFLDYDNDGDLDLFVANYLQFDFASAPAPGSNPLCYYRDMPVNCGPRGLPFDRNLLYRNNGDGTFTDVSAASGIAKPDRNYSLGVITGDFNDDGFTDLYVACDRTPSLLYINQGNGTFADEGLLRGVALDEHGAALSGMGVAAADYDGDGVADIFRTNFSDERETLYKASGGGNFEDATAAAGLAHNTRYVGWGCGFLDFDNDGLRDLLLVNGHVFPEVDRLGIDVTHKQRPILYRNRGGGRFDDVSESAGPAMLARHSSRGAAFADLDNDGSVEVVVNHQNEAPSLLRNAAPPKDRNWIILKLNGTRSNRSAIGARVAIEAGGLRQTAEVRGGGSYLSQNDLRLHFGLGAASKVDRIEIRWPSGAVQVLTNATARQVLAIVEPKL